MDALTVEQFKNALPAQIKKSVNPELIDKINKTLNDPDMYETYRDHLLGYVQVMKDGKFKLSCYIDAVKYVSHKLLGKTNFDAFSITFPEKIQRWSAKGVAPKDMASYVTAYNKSKMVSLLMEQSLIPSWVLNQDLYQKAINVQAELMVSANSEKVRSDAANSLLTHLKPPETQKVELSVSTSEDSSISALRASTMALVAAQKNILMAGAMNAQEVAHSRLVIEGDSERVG
jgi:hypothetical protein